MTLNEFYNKYNEMLELRKVCTGSKKPIDIDCVNEENLHDYAKLRLIQNEIMPFAFNQQDKILDYFQEETPETFKEGIVGYDERMKPIAIFYTDRDCLLLKKTDYLKKGFYNIYTSDIRTELEHEVFCWKELSDRNVIEIIQTFAEVNEFLSDEMEEYFLTTSSANMDLKSYDYIKGNTLWCLNCMHDSYKLYKKYKKLRKDNVNNICDILKDFDLYESFELDSKYNTKDNDWTNLFDSYN